MQISEGKGITDTLSVQMQHTAYIFLIHERAFNPAETREKYKNLHCRSVCRGPEDLIDWKILPVVYLDIETLEQAHSTCIQFPILQLMALMFYDSF